MPPPGSPAELVMVMVWQMKQEIGFYAHHVLVQATANPEDGDAVQAAWKRFRNALFPHHEAETQKSDSDAMDALKQAIEEGPLAISALAPMVQSKMAVLRDKLKSKE